MSPSPSRQAGQVARELGGRVAVAGALLVALISTIQHAPLWQTSLRGLGTLFVLTLGARLGTAALCRAIDSDRNWIASKKEEGVP